MEPPPAHREYRQFRVPRDNRGVLAEPPLEAVALQVEHNRRLRQQADYDVQGRSLQQLLPQARQEIIQQAHQYTASYRDVPQVAANAWETVVLAGHQPQLFHPGVWLKNFVLGHLSARLGVTAINLLIDSDTVKGLAVAVPGGSVAQPELQTIPLDRVAPRISYEQYAIADRDGFSQFGQRVQQQIAPLVPDPLIEQYWPLVLGRMGWTSNLGECLAQARHQIEAAWGATTLEVPQSKVCDNESFCWFLTHLLAQLPRFLEAYNGALRDYRRAHRLRGATQPIADLAVDHGWLEAPFWVWTQEDPLRRRLFVRATSRSVRLSDRARLDLELPLSSGSDGRKAVQCLLDCNRQGVKIRSRALTTTLWARLVLGDLFIHGIGGAKYDQVTDLLIERFLGLRPPGVMVVSGTLQLPTARAEVAAGSLQAIAQRLRELTYHPERYLDPAGRTSGGTFEDSAALATEKLQWIQTPATADNACRRCRAIRRINESLQPWVAAERSRLLEQREEMARALRADQVLASREYAFCLYPARTLREFVVGVLPKIG